MAKTFTYLTLCFFVAILLCITTFNIIIDSNNIFRPSKLESVAKMLTTGNNVAYKESNMDERILQKYIVQKLLFTPHTIAIGSSRIMNLHKEFLYGEKYFFNHGMSGSTINDYYAILGLYVAYHARLPKRIIFGLDPWIFNANSGELRYLSINDYASLMQEKIHGKQHTQSTKIKTSFFIKCKEAISFKQTQGNIHAILKGNIKQEFFTTQSTDTQYLVYANDGSIYYPMYKRNPSDKEIINGVAGFKNYQITGFKSLNTQAFIELMNYLLTQNIELVFYLPPYNPKLYEILQNDEKYKNIFNARDFIKNYAKTHNIKIYGDYDPNVLGGKFNDFLDGVHTKDVFMKKIFSTYKSK